MWSFMWPSARSIPASRGFMTKPSAQLRSTVQCGQASHGSVESWIAMHMLDLWCSTPCQFVSLMDDNMDDNISLPRLWRAMFINCQRTAVRRAWQNHIQPYGTNMTICIQLPTLRLLGNSLPFEIPSDWRRSKISWKVMGKNLSNFRQILLQLLHLDKKGHFSFSKR